MKKLFLLLMLISSVFALDEIEWLDDFDEAKYLAQKQNKPILIYMRSEFCHYCRVMNKETFIDKAIVKRIMTEFIPLKLDNNQDYDSDLEGTPPEYNVSFTPAYHFIGPGEEKLAKRGTTLMTIYGYWNINDFDGWLNDAQRRYTNIVKDTYKQ